MNTNSTPAGNRPAPPASLNGWQIVRIIGIGTRYPTIYLRLPTAFRLSIDSCRCTYCATHPDEPPTWDTLGVATGPDQRYATWTIHAPEWQKRAEVPA